MSTRARYLVTVSVMALSVVLGPGRGEATSIQWTIGSGGNGHFYELFGHFDSTYNEADAAAVALGGSRYLDLCGRERVHPRTSSRPPS